MEQKFKVGDRVTTTYFPIDLPGPTQTATIVDVVNYYYLIEFDADTNKGHEGYGRFPGSKKHWFVNDGHITLIPKKDYGIFTVGTKLARDGKHFGTVVAVDEHDVVYIDNGNTHLEDSSYWRERFKDLGLPGSYYYTTNLRYAHLYRVFEEPKKVEKPPVRRFSYHTQNGKILAHLASGNTITPLKARQFFDVESLSRRICDLKDAGHKIKSRIEVDPTGKRFARYWIDKKGKAA